MQEMDYITMGRVHFTNMQWFFPKREYAGVIGLVSVRKKYARSNE